MKKNIVIKYINLLMLASAFSRKIWKKILDEIDLLIWLVYLFSFNTYLKDKFIKFDFDIDRFLSALIKDYGISSALDFSSLNFELKISSSLIDIFEEADILEYDMAPLSIFFNLLSTKKVGSYINRLWLFDLIYEKFDIINFYEDFYADKKLKMEMKKIFKKLFDADKISEDDFKRISFASDDYNDFDIELEDEDDNKNITNATKDDKNEPNKTKLVIDTFGINLNNLARNWQLEPVVGREKELNELIYTLLRKTKNNPLLVWEAWVGKTAIVEWLAQRIEAWKVPEKLKWKQVYTLDMGTLVAWTKYRWEFEARLKSIIQEAIDPENWIILFIDEIHTVIWAWNAEWGADTANLLKPYLARWELTLIGATTFDEYRKYIEKDPALTRRFQLIRVEEPSEKDAIELLEGIKYRFEDFHGVNLTTEAIEKAVRLSKRYILDRHLPDKAIDLIDEAAARKSTKVISKERKTKIKKLEDKIAEIEKKVQKAVKEQDYFAAAEYKEQITKLSWEIKNLKLSNDVPKNLRVNVWAEDIEKVIAEKYWISTKVLSKLELDFLSDLEKTLNSEIVWQEEAVREVVSAIIRNKLSPIEKNKPIWSFLFLWPSGVWKTYLASLLAKHFFQDDKALIKINMSEYSQDMASNKLTWSAPWYVWYEEWWILTEAVRKKPYSVVLFDEIEKGSPQILNVLLQILDQGYLEDNKWRKVDFKNTIIILTSNLGSEYFSKEITKVWFDMSEDENNSLSEEKKELIMQDVKNLLPIELLNRLDNIVFFNLIDKDLLHKIFDKYYKDYRKLWKEKKWIQVPSIKKDEVKALIEKIHKEGAGVRWIEKYLYNELENKVIEKLLKLKK